MGIMQIIAIIRNLAEPTRIWEGRFLVGAGVIDSLVPRPCLEAICLEPNGQRVYGLADGSKVKMDITVGQIECMEEITGGTIVFGKVDAEPKLGMAALASLDGSSLDRETRVAVALQLRRGERAVSRGAAACVPRGDAV